MNDDRRADLRRRLADIPDQLAVAARAAADRPVPDGEWTPAEVVRHLIAVEEEVWHPRLRQLATEDRPKWPWAEPDRWLGSPGASLDDLLAIYAGDRGATIEILDALGETGWARTGEHATYGVLDVAGLMDRAIDHDDEHIASFVDRRLAGDPSEAVDPGRPHANDELPLNAIPPAELLRPVRANVLRAKERRDPAAHREVVDQLGLALDRHVVVRRLRVLDDDATCGSRRIFAALTVVCHVVKTISLPSTAYHVGTAWGRPSGRTLAKVAGREPFRRKPRASSSVIRSIVRSPARP